MFDCVYKVVLAASIGLGAVFSNPGAALAARGELVDQVPQTNMVVDLFPAQQVPSSTVGRPSVPDELQIAFADDITRAIVLQLQRGTDRCNRLQVVYRLDCLGEAYAQAAGVAGNRPDYAAATSQLRKVSRQLKGIVRKNQDRNAEKAKLGNKSYRAVKRDALRSANQQATKIIEEAATQLLRSAGNSKKRKVHYTRIANAVNSTKKILRS